MAVKTLCELEGLYWIYGFKIKVVSGSKYPEELIKTKRQDPNINVYDVDDTAYIWINDITNLKENFKDFISGMEYIIDYYIGDMGIKIRDSKGEAEMAISESLSYIRSGLIEEYLYRTHLPLKIKKEAYEKTYSYENSIFKSSKLNINFSEKDEDLSLDDKLDNPELFGCGLCKDDEVIVRNDKISTLIHEVGHYLDKEFSIFFVKTLGGIEKTSLKITFYKKVIDDLVEENECPITSSN